MSNIPTYGQTLYVRLYSLIKGAWQYKDYTYTQGRRAGAGGAHLPTPGSTLTGSTATFNWTAGGGVT